MTYENIPPGQLRLYKALFEAGETGLVFEELSRTSDCTMDETRSTLGALGNRVTQALGKIFDKPSRLLIERNKNGIYTLSPILLKFIADTPSFQKALRGSSMEMFLLHSKTAWAFEWDAGEMEGRLVEFTRD
jgi:hypothetical protein